VIPAEKTQKLTAEIANSRLAMTGNQIMGMLFRDCLTSCGCRGRLPLLGVDLLDPLRVCQGDCERPPGHEGDHRAHGLQRDMQDRPPGWGHLEVARPARGFPLLVMRFTLTPWSLDIPRNFPTAIYVEQRADYIAECHREDLLEGVVHRGPRCAAQRPAVRRSRVLEQAQDPGLMRLRRFVRVREKFVALLLCEAGADKRPSSNRSLYPKC
jgi:hypothetical protein